MKIWSDIMNSLMNIINNSTFYYVAVALAYVLVIFFVIFLLVKNKRKRIERVKIEDALLVTLDKVDKIKNSQISNLGDHIEIDYIEKYTK